ncbi:MAG: hypothetical protein NZX77_22045, partial [Polyangiaceae bacterium]|nr:hypothetical protein [Polyangiaceae bacterium]
MSCGLLLGLFLGGILLSRERLRTRRAQAERAIAVQLSTIQQTLLTLDLPHLLQHFADAVIKAVPCRGVGVLLLAPQSWMIERMVVTGQIAAAEFEAFCRTLLTTQPVTEVLQRGPLLFNAPQDIRRQFPTLQPEMAQKNLLI